jgi:AcrR family transcriptional regulator
VRHARRQHPLPDLRSSDSHIEPPRQARSIATRTQLLTSGRVLFGTVGYQAASVKDITAHAGLAVGAFYKHFSSKRHLLVALMKEQLQRLGAIDLRPDLRYPASPRVRAALRIHFHHIFHDDVDFFYVARAWKEGEVADAEIGAMHADITAWSERNIHRLLQHLLKLPNARPEVDIPALAFLINQYMWTLLGRAATIPREEFDRQMRTIADLIYHYLFRDTSA